MLCTQVVAIALAEREQEMAAPVAPIALTALVGREGRILQARCQAPV